MLYWRAGDRSIVCAGAGWARLGSIAARCETSRSSAAASCALVVGVDLGVVSTPGNRDVRQAPIHELLSGSLHVDVHEDPVGCLSLTAVARDGVAVVQVRMGADIEGDRAA
jgi:hypothetical protein